MSVTHLSEESREYPYWRRNLTVLPVANLLCSLGFALSWPFLPLMFRGLGVQNHLETWTGYTMLGFNVIGFAINPIWGGIADHYGRKIMVLRAMVGMGCVMVLVPFAQTPVAFAAMVILVGFFYGYMPAGMSLLVANTPQRRIGSALAFAQTGSLVGQTTGPAAGAMLAVLVERLHAMFWMSGGLMLFGGLLVALLVREVKQTLAGSWRPDWFGSLRELLAVPHMGPLFVLSFLFAALWYGSVTIISVYMLELLRAEPPAAGTEAFWVGAAAMGIALVSVIAMPFWGRALDRFGPVRILVIATTAAVVTHVPLVVLKTPLQLVLSRLAFGLTGVAMLPAIVQLIRINAPAGTDARAIAYGSSFQCVGMGLAPFCAGVIGPVFGLRTYFALFTLLTLGGLLLWLRSARSGSPTED